MSDFCTNCGINRIVTTSGLCNECAAPKVVNGFLAARGILAYGWTGEPAEVSIRRLRDTEPQHPANQYTDAAQHLQAMRQRADEGG